MSEDGRVNGLKQLGESAVNTVLDRVGRGVGKVQERRPLAYDLLESDDAYLVVFDTPGVSNTDVQVQFREGAVELQVDRFRDFYEGFEMRFPGRGLSLDGRAELPADAAVDPRTAEATLTEHGTLEVSVPKDDDSVAVGETDDDSVAVGETDDDSVAVGEREAEPDDGEPIQLDPDADAEPGHEDDESDAGEARDETHEAGDAGEEDRNDTVSADHEASDEEHADGHEASDEEHADGHEASDDTDDRQ